MADYVDNSTIKAQAWKFYFALAAWPAYFLVLPWVFARFGFFSLVFMVFPGLYLFTWAGFLMHESWHAYVPSVNSKFFYRAFSYALLTDPQVYRLAHGYHHSMVHTWDDVEFHPLGHIKNGFLRVLYNSMEILFGIIFISLAGAYAVIRHPKVGKLYKFSGAALSYPLIAGYLFLLGFLSRSIFRVKVSEIVLSYAVSMLINSFILHASQLVEHGNLIVEGDFNERNIWTRNLEPSGWPEKVFLFLTHGDSREHVLHHTLTPQYLRPFPGRAPMPDKAVYITLGDYFRILADMFRGRVQYITPS